MNFVSETEEVSSPAKDLSVTSYPAAIESIRNATTLTEIENFILAYKDIYKENYLLAVLLAKLEKIKELKSDVIHEKQLQDRLDSIILTRSTKSEYKKIGKIILDNFTIFIQNNLDPSQYMSNLLLWPKLVKLYGLEQAIFIVKNKKKTEIENLIKSITHTGSDDLYLSYRLGVREEI